MGREGKKKKKARGGARSRIIRIKIAAHRRSSVTSVSTRHARTKVNAALAVAAMGKCLPILVVGILLSSPVCTPLIRSIIRCFEGLPNNT